MRRTLAITVGVAAAGTLAAGCSQEQASVVDGALKQNIKSADMAIDVRFSQGGQGASFHLAGPVVDEGPTKLPKLDWTASVTVPGQKPLEAEIISDGDRAAVVYGGQTYQVPSSAIAGLEHQAKKDQHSGGEQVQSLGDLQRLGVDLSKWFPQSDGPTDATLRGEPTKRVTGRLDVSAALADVGKLLTRPGVRKQLGVKAAAAPKITPEIARQIDHAITDPQFEMQVGRDDGKLRRLAGSLRFTGQGRMSFSVDLANVDKPLTVKAVPSGGRPIGELMQRLQALGGAGRLAKGSVKKS